MRHHTRFLALVCPVCALAPLANAQHGPPMPSIEEDPPASPEPAKSRVSASLDLFANHVLTADFDASPGDVSLTRIGSQLGVNADLGERRSLGIGFTAMHTWYEFDGATGFGTSGEPWDTVAELDLALRYNAPINDRWGFLVGANVNAAFENGADFADALTFGGRGGVTYSISEQATIGLGVAVTSRLEEDAFIVPFPFIAWEITEQWRLGSYGSSRGSGLALSYSPSETWTFTVRAGVEAHEFRLDDAGPTPDGVGRAWHVPIELLAQWKVHPQVTVVAGVGLVAWQQYTLDDAAGNEIAEINADAAFAFGVGVTFTF
jgi:hypothetical protein